MGLTKKQYKECIKVELGGKSFLNKHIVGSYNAVYLIRKAQYLCDKNFIKRVFSKVCLYKLIKNYGIFFNPNCNIGIGLHLPHPNGIIIGQAVKIGENCKIYQQVTIGSANKGDYLKGKQPIIGNNCILFSGAKIIGQIKMGDNTIVGTNSVLRNDTEVDSVYAGVPAKKIK